MLEVLVNEGLKTDIDDKGLQQISDDTPGLRFPLSPLKLHTDLQRQFKSVGSGSLWKVPVVSMATELYFGRKILRAS